MTNNTLTLDTENSKTTVYSNNKKAQMMNNYLGIQARRVPMAYVVSTKRLTKHQAKRSKHIAPIDLKASHRRFGLKSFKWLGAIVMLGGLLNLTGCAQLGINKQEFGAATGAVLGGVLGSTIGHGVGKTVATIGGALVGGAIGGAIGSSMDKVDRMAMNQALEKEPTNRSASWRNPGNGNRYRITPTRTYYEGRQPCREYTLNAKIGGETKQVYGRACRTSSGAWHIVS
jgi:surface antigen